MNAVHAILWFIAIVINVFAIFHYIGFSGLTRMFPEGYRRWHLPVQLVTLAVFAILVLCNPWQYQY